MKAKYLFPLMLLFALLVFTPTYAQTTVEDQFFDSNGVKIHYTVQGEGEPVVLIHGFSADIDLQWRNAGIIDALDDDYRVIAISNRGHGKSDKPHGAENYGTEMAEDVVRLLDHLGIEKAHIVGYSMGGFITLNLIVNHPDRIITAAPCGAGWAPPDGPMTQFAENLATSLESGQGFGPLLEMLTPAGEEKPGEEQVQALNAILTQRNDVIALAGAIRGMRKLAVKLEQIQANEVPTLAVIGSVDPLKLGTDAMVAVMPNVKAVVVDGANHMNCFTRPEFIAALKDFLAEDGASARGLEPAGAATK